MMRVDVKRVISAHTFDPSRRDLFVEGIRDKTFFDWLVPLRERNNASIILIESVDIPDVTEGGERSRTIELMRQVESEGLAIRAIVDSDSHRLRASPEVVPNGVWVTDFRDLESYVLSVRNLETLLQLGFAKDPTPAAQLFASMTNEARWLAAARLVSEEQQLKLPISKEEPKSKKRIWEKQITVDRYGSVAINRPAMLQALLQRAGHSLRLIDKLGDDIEGAGEKLSLLDDSYVIHGKDAVLLLTHQLNSLGCSVSDAGPLLWTTFRIEDVSHYPVLNDVVDFLRS